MTYNFDKMIESDKGFWDIMSLLFLMTWYDCDVELPSLEDIKKHIKNKEYDVMDWEQMAEEEGIFYKHYCENTHKHLDTLDWEWILENLHQYQSQSKYDRVEVYCNLETYYLALSCEEEEDKVRKACIQYYEQNNLEYQQHLAYERENAWKKASVMVEIVADY